MIYAQIKNNTVQNIIVLQDTSLVSVFTEGYDYCVRIDNLPEVPSIGWAYDGQNFIKPNLTLPLIR